MAYTVRKLLESEQFPKMKLLCGEKGLDLEVKGIRIIEIEDMERYLTGGEILITSFQVYLSCNDREVEQHFEDLVKSDISGFIVKKRKEYDPTGRRLSLLEKHCKKYEIPLVEISEDLHYWGIIRYVIMQVFDKATARLKYFKITHDNFNTFILNNNGSCNTASDIIKFLSIMIENPVVLYYGNLNCMVSTNSDNSKLILSDEIQPYKPNIITKFQYMKQMKGSSVQYVTLKPEYSPYYVSSFVNCRYGQNQIARFKTITGQPNINMGLIKYLLIPKVPDEINELIEKSVILAIEKMEEANKKSEFVEHEISRLLNIESWKISSDSTVVRSSKQLLANERWDAEFFQSKYDDFERYIKAYSNGYTTPRAEFEHIKTKCSHELVEYNYLEIGDIDVGNGSSTPHVVPEEELPGNAKIMAKMGDIVVSTVRPYRGAISVLRENELLVSGAFTVLRQKSKYPPQTLQALFRTDLYKEWFLKFNVGTSYPVIKDDDVLDIPIPIFDDDDNKRIVENVENASVLFEQAKHLLLRVRCAVEKAVENNEVEAKAILLALLAKE